MTVVCSSFPAKGPDTANTHACVHTCTHTHKCAYPHMHECAHRHVYIATHMHAYTQHMGTHTTPMHARVSAGAHPSTRTHMHTLPPLALPSLELSVFSTAALGEKVLSTSTLEDWLCTFLQPHLALAQPVPPQMKCHSPPDPTITGGVLPATKSPHRKFFIFIPPSEIHFGKCPLFQCKMRGTTMLPVATPNPQ